MCIYSSYYFEDNVDKEKTVAQLKNFLKCLDIVLSQPTADASNAFIKLAKKVMTTFNSRDITALTNNVPAHREEIAPTQRGQEKAKVG